MQSSLAIIEKLLISFGITPKMQRSDSLHPLDRTIILPHESR
ncbi:hypothetical protein LEP1GSC026_1167 [Leptospira interrogans str. 2002000623]|nr:hypothetical protein LEP1GSC026_1167 [Leptospira interrogans str. 2002000623]EMJ75862.1 hypothetical protein LEP1GSC033_3060 [Leptospira interrogans str. 2002000632]